MLLVQFSSLDAAIIFYQHQELCALAHSIFRQILLVGTSKQNDRTIENNYWDPDQNDCGLSGRERSGDKLTKNPQKLVTLYGIWDAIIMVD